MMFVEVQRPGVSRPPPTRSPTVKTDAQLAQLGGSAARRVGRELRLAWMLLTIIP
jgi:hypothetical protein